MEDRQNKQINDQKEAQRRVERDAAAAMTKEKPETSATHDHDAEPDSEGESGETKKSGMKGVGYRLGGEEEEVANGGQ